MASNTENVAAVLERELQATIDRWMKRVEEVPSLMEVRLSREERMGHLPQLIEDLIARLQQEEEAERPVTTSAHDHGEVRFEQGYSVPMLVEESRLIQVSIFDTLRRNQAKLDLTRMMSGVVIIADECDAQLKDTVETFMDLENEEEASSEKQGKPRVA